VLEAAREHHRRKASEPDGANGSPLALDALGDAHAAPPQAPATSRSAAGDLLARPLDERTRLIVVRDDAYASLHRIPRSIANAAGAAISASAAAGVRPSAALIGSPVGFVTIVGAAVGYPAYRKWLQPHMPLIHALVMLDAHVVPLAVATHCRMPLGDPEVSTLYVAHPRLTVEYLPAGPFHRVLVQERIGEAVQLIRALGAQTIEIIPGAPEASSGSTEAMVLQSTATLIGVNEVELLTDPHTSGLVMHCAGGEAAYVPDDLRWLEVEPTWRNVIVERLERDPPPERVHPLVQFDDAYGFDPTLAEPAMKCGIRLGGELTYPPTNALADLRGVPALLGGLTADPRRSGGEPPALDSARCARRCACAPAGR
jgi:hypothetical protein